jgi:hypothetical protein
MFANDGTRLAEILFNDREVVVPHRIHWPVPATLKPRGDGEVAARWSAEGRKGSPPARPLMSTVDMAAEVKAEIARSEQPTSAPKPEVAPVFAPTPVPAQPVRRTPRFRTENERRLYAEDRLGQIPRDEALSIPGFDVIRPPLRSADPEERASYIEARTRSVELARTLRALEAAGTAPPLRQVRVEQVVAVDPAFRSNVQEAIQRSGEASQIAPILIRRGGVLYAHENVEEVVAAHLAERRTVQAHVIDLDAKKPWPTPPKKIEPPPVSTPTSRPRVPVELVSKDFAAHADAAGLEVFDHAKFNAAASKVFTRGMPTVDTLQKTWGSDEAGHTIKLTSAGAYGSRVSFSGDIMAGSRKIGSITRTFIRHDDGTLEVHHDFFKIEDVKEQGSKSGSTMLRQAIQTYEKIGVNEVTVDAAWVGRYAWATFGYNWDAGTARERGHGLGVYLQSKGVEAARAKTIAEQAAKRAWDVAALDVDGITVNVESEGRRIDCKVGKAFLLESGGKGGAGQMWSGKIVLDPSHETYKRAKERIGL